MPSSYVSVDADASSIHPEHSEVATTFSLIPFSSIVGAKSISISLFGNPEGVTSSAILGAIAACILSLEN